MRLLRLQVHILIKNKSNSLEVFVCNGDVASHAAHSVVLSRDLRLINFLGLFQLLLTVLP